MAQVFELVKNSLRAVNDRYHDSDDIAPPVQVVVAEGSEDVTIKVHSRTQPLTCAFLNTARHGRPLILFMTHVALVRVACGSNLLALMPALAFGKV